LSKTVDLKDYIKEMQEQYGFSLKEIMEAAKVLYQAEAISKSTWLPSIRCTSEFRKETEEAAAKSGMKISEYIYETVESENWRVKNEKNR
jgi:hypothetical protein